MEASGLWVANDDGTEIVRARDIAEVVLDYNGNVTARLAGHDTIVVTLVAHRTREDEHKPGDLHRQLLRVMAELSDSSGAQLVRPVHDESRGWKWVSEPLQRCLPPWLLMIARVDDSLAWATRVTELAQRLQAALERHPGLASLLKTRDPLSPHSLALGSGIARVAAGRRDARPPDHLGLPADLRLHSRFPSAQERLSSLPAPGNAKACRAC